MPKNQHNFFDQEFMSRLEQLHLIAKRVSWRRWSAHRRSRRMGDGLEFADHRAYASGDDIRFIDWPYFARMEKLLLRMFHEHSANDVVILLDSSGSMAPPGRACKFDYARKVAAALAYVAMGSLERVILQTFSGHLGRRMHTGRNRGQVLEVLEFLASLQTGGTTELRRCAEMFARRTPCPATVLMISDLLDCCDDGQLGEALKQLRARGHDVTLLHLYSPQDARPQLCGPVLLRYAEGGRQMNVDVTDELLASYHARWDEFHRRCRAECISREAMYVPVCTDVPFEKLILQTLCGAGVLGA